MNIGNDVMKRWRMKINRKKTKIIVISRQKENVEINIEDMQLKQTKRFK